MKTVVITGADGFIGRHLVSFFSSMNYHIYAIVLPGSNTQNHIKSLPNVDILNGYLSDYHSFIEKIPVGINAFIHLAWNGVAPETRNSISIQAENIKISLDAVKIASLVHAQKFIFPGSSLEYSYCGQLINEKALPSPQNAYGAAKISARYMCEAMCREMKIPYIYAVITSIYGADRDDNNVISYCIKKLLLKEKPSFTKLEQLWDYIHIDDLVNALYLISTKGKGGAFYSIGHGDNWELSRYISIIHNLIDPQLPLGIGECPYQNDRLPSSCIDLTAIEKDTGFIPRISFENGIKSVIDRFRLQLGSGNI